MQRIKGFTQTDFSLKCGFSLYKRLVGIFSIRQNTFSSVKNLRGFTLIELLVVISIITLLSSIVISALGSARTKASDNAVKAGMKQLHSQAQNYLDNTGATSFGTATDCSTGLFANTQMNAILANISQNGAPIPVLACGSLSNNWAVSVNLKGGSNWCTDNSQGWFKAGTANTGTGQCQ